jgi:DNA-binding CsgD family transcriptional regulator
MARGIAAGRQRTAGAQRGREAVVRERQASAAEADASHLFLDALPDMLFRMSRDGRYLDFKPAHQLRPFVPPEQFLGRTVAQVLPDAVAGDVMSAIGAALSSGETQTYEYELPLDDGPHGYEARIVPLGPDDVLAIVRDVTEQPRHYVTGQPKENGYGLTERELAVLRLVTVGVTDKEIAQRLAISVMTARNHVASIRRKMGAASRTEASVRAIQEAVI